MPVNFGRKIAWIAVADVSGEALAAALGVEISGPEEWEAGVDAAYMYPSGEGGAGAVYITPPLRGWTLCAGACLFDMPKGFSAAISGKLGGLEVQCFVTHRVSELHAWERAIYGETVRYFIDVDGGRVEEGDATLTEVEIGLRSGASNSSGEEPVDIWMPDEEYVLVLAGAWSINPDNIADEFPLIGLGVAGSLRLPPCDRLLAQLPS